MNDVGEPCAGERHARFDRGPLGRPFPWRDGIHAPDRETGGTEPVRPTGTAEPAAYLTERHWSIVPMALNRLGWTLGAAKGSESASGTTAGAR
jgi:hypothetical protein